MQKDIKGEGGEGQKEEEGRKENKTTFTSGQARILLPKLICVHVLRNRSSGSNQIFVKKNRLVCTDGAVWQNPEIVQRMGVRIWPPRTYERRSLKVERSAVMRKMVPSLD